MSVHDPRFKNSVVSGDLVKLLTIKKLTFESLFFPRDLEWELTERDNLDKFGKKIVSATLFDIDELLDSEAVKEESVMWSNLYYLNFMLKCRVEFTDDQFDKYLHLLYRSVYVRRNYDEIKELVAFSDDEVKLLATIMLTVVKALRLGMAGVQQYLAKQPESIVMQCLPDLNFIINPLSLSDCYDYWKLDHNVIKCLPNEVVKGFEEEIIQIFSDYPDDEFAENAIVYLANLMVYQVQQNENIDFDKLIEENKKLFRRYGVELLGSKRAVRILQ